MTDLVQGANVVVSFAANEAVTVTTSGECLLEYLDGDRAGSTSVQATPRKNHSHPKPGQVRVTALRGTANVLQAGSTISRQIDLVALVALLNSIPTTFPSSSGILWNNGGVFTVS